MQKAEFQKQQLAQQLKKTRLKVKRKLEVLFREAEKALRKLERVNCDFDATMKKIDAEIATLVKRREETQALLKLQESRNSAQPTEYKKRGIVS